MYLIVTEGWFILSKTFVCVLFQNKIKISLNINVLLLALMITIVTANVRLQRSPQQYCGSKLADIMKVLCKSNYNGPNLQKKRQISKFIIYSLIPI